MLYESRSRAERNRCGVESQFAITAVWLWARHLNWLSQFPHQYNVGIMLVTQDHGGRIGLSFRGCSWWLVNQESSAPNHKGAFTTHSIYTQTPGLFLEKKSKVYWNFKLHLRNPNPNPGDIHQDKVSESGKYSLPQNLLETSSLSTSPRHHHSKPLPCLSLVHKRTPPSQLFSLLKSFPQTFKNFLNNNVKSQLIFYQPHSM